MGILDSIFGRDDSADEARRREEERRNRLRQGRDSINQKFSIFDDAFFDGARQSALDRLVPELENRFEDASGQALFSAARSGNLGSSAAIKNDAKLLENLARGRQDVQFQADDFVNNLRGNVEDARTDAINLLMATEDPTVGANAAASRARAISPTSGIENLIAPVVEQGVNLFGNSIGFDRRLGIARNGDAAQGPLQQTFRNIFSGGSSKLLG